MNDEELEAQLERTNSKIKELEACQQGAGTESVPSAGGSSGAGGQDLLGLFSGMPDDAMLSRLPSNSLLSLFPGTTQHPASAPEPSEGSAGQQESEMADQFVKDSESGKVGGVERWLAGGNEPNVKSAGWTALQAASGNKQAEVVRVLLGCGRPDINATDDTSLGWTALHCAAATDSVDAGSPLRVAPPHSLTRPPPANQLTSAPPPPRPLCCSTEQSRAAPLPCATFPAPGAAISRRPPPNGHHATTAGRRVRIRPNSLVTYKFIIDL